MLQRHAPSAPPPRLAARASRRPAAAPPCCAAAAGATAPAQPPFLTPAGPPLCELPHAHDTHVAVAVAPVRVRLAAGRALTLVTPEDPLAVETMHALLGEEVDAVWAEVWPSAVAMADELFECPELVAGASVCELGAGVALGGLAAAAAGAARVIVTDREPRALWCALAGAAANGLPAAPLPPLPPGAPRLPPLPPACAGAPIMHAAVLDWDAPLPPALRAAFDVLLLCDVLYQPDSVGRIADVTAHLLRPGGRVLLADTAYRPGKAGLRARFLDALLARGGGGLQLAARRTRVVAMPAPAADSNTGDAHPVEISVIAPAAWQRAAAEGSCVGAAVDGGVCELAGDAADLASQSPRAPSSTCCTCAPLSAPAAAARAAASASLRRGQRCLRLAVGGPGCASRAPPTSSLPREVIAPWSPPRARLDGKFAAARRKTGVMACCETCTEYGCQRCHQLVNVGWVDDFMPPGTSWTCGLHAQAEVLHSECSRRSFGLLLNMTCMP